MSYGVNKEIIRRYLIDYFQSSRQIINSFNFNSSNQASLQKKLDKLDDDFAETIAEALEPLIEEKKERL